MVEQKQWGMPWSEVISDRLASLPTVILNGGWAHYWVDAAVLLLMEAA